MWYNMPMKLPEYAKGLELSYKTEKIIEELND